MKSFLDRLGTEELIIELTSEDKRLAIAVLYYRVILVDGRIRDSEINRYREILSENLNITEDEMLLFEDAVKSRITNGDSTFPLLHTLKGLPLKERIEILSNMHAISVSDRELHEFEINLVHRAAELLDIAENHLSSIMTRKRKPMNFGN